MGQLLFLYHSLGSPAIFWQLLQSYTLWVQSKPILFNPLEELSQVYEVAIPNLGFHYHIINIHLYLIMHHIM